MSENRFIYLYMNYRINAMTFVATDIGKRTSGTQFAELAETVAVDAAAERERR